MDINYCPCHLRKTHFQTVYYTHTIEIHTNKGAKSYKLKLSEIGNYKVESKITSDFTAQCSLLTYTYR